MGREEQGGAAVPSDLFPPNLLPGADDLIAAFWEISTDRQIGMQAGPIPSFAIERMAGRMGIAHPDEFDDFRSAMRVMDAVWLDNGKTPAVPAPGEPKVSERPMSPALFDALF